jgi:uncharacterized protein
MTNRKIFKTVLAGLMPVFLIGIALVLLNLPATAAPIRDPAHSYEKYVCNWKQLKQMNIVMQKRDYSCGAAAMATVLQYFWSDNVTENQILAAIEKILTPEEMQDRIKKGLAISDLRRAAVEMGYLSTVGTLTFTQLSESKVPLIVGISPDGYDHFVVYRGMDCDYVYLADPIRGNIRLTHHEFVHQWQKNAALVIAKTDQDPPATSPLAVKGYETRLGELNNHVIRTMPSKPFTQPIVP